MTGIIKSYSGKRGYGFIRTENKDYFFMHTDFITKPNGYCKVGNKVDFFPISGSKGLHATQINVI